MRSFNFRIRKRSQKILNHVAISGGQEIASERKKYCRLCCFSHGFTRLRHTPGANGAQSRAKASAEAGDDQCRRDPDGSE